MEWIIAYLVIGVLIAELGRGDIEKSTAPRTIYILAILCWGITLPLGVLIKWIKNTR